MMTPRTGSNCGSEDGERGWRHVEGIGLVRSGPRRRHRACLQRPPLTAQRPPLPRPRSPQRITSANNPTMELSSPGLDRHPAQACGKTQTLKRECEGRESEERPRWPTATAPKYQGNHLQYLSASFEWQRQRLSQRAEMQRSELSRALPRQGASIPPQRSNSQVNGLDFRTLDRTIPSTKWKRSPSPWIGAASKPRGSWSDYIL